MFIILIITNGPLSRREGGGSEEGQLIGLNSWGLGVSKEPEVHWVVGRKNLSLFLVLKMEDFGITSTY